MSQTTETKYYCDLCNKELKTTSNTLAIVTEMERYLSSRWARLTVKIVCSSGFHNDGKTTEAELCKTCATNLLTDAVKRVRNGERATKGVESSNQEGWSR